MKAPPGGVLDRLAGAPISWGVCEVPGWGVMLPRERVLSEMRELGLKASELGALGYLGDDPAQIGSLLSSFSLGCVGGFVPVALHDASVREQAEQDAVQAAHLLQGAGGTYFVTAAVVDADWSAPFELDEHQWDDLASGLDMVGRVCAAHGLIQVLHPHVGTLVERAEHVDQVLRRSDVRFCLDTGHFSIGGADPVAFAGEYGSRVGLVHLKDVDMSVAPAVRDHQTHSAGGDPGRAVPGTRAGQRRHHRDGPGPGSERLRRLVRAGAGHDGGRSGGRLRRPRRRREGEHRLPAGGAGPRGGRVVSRTVAPRPGGSDFVRIGVIGTGRIGRMHAELLAAGVPGATLAAISDAVTPLADQVGRALGVPVLETDRVIDDPEIDAVAICASTDTHVPLIVAAAEAGKAVFCEKPVSLDLAEVDRALAVVGRTGTQLMVGFNRRFDASHAAVRDAVAGGAVGAPHVARITSRDPGPPPMEYARTSGGIFLDMTIHDFDMARFVVGSEVAEVYATGAVRVVPELAEIGDVDTAVVTLWHENECLTVIDNSRRATYGYDQRVEVLGADGMAGIRKPIGQRSADP